ncbi:MAG: hypothetical protein Q8P51_12685 [Ignavibacteria bacterium]|nr:hypothetical protein [Ignavibacteria bacterium]
MSPLTPTLQELEKLLIQSGDLPAGFTGGQVREQAPGMFSELPKPNFSIYQQLVLRGEQAGGVTLLVYPDSVKAREAFQGIVSGFAPTEDQSLYKQSIGTVDNIGESCTQCLGLAQSEELLGMPLKDMGDIVSIRKAIISHVRMTGTADPQDLQSYLRRLDRRIAQYIGVHEK